MFAKTDAIEKQFHQFDLHLADTVNRLQAYDTESENFSTIINKLRSDFSVKITDFYKKDRKLRLAVIGQVKAGKSSFLNTLLFDGKDILPRAATPKTANLTLIEYGDRNAIEVEFYSEREWSDLIDLSKHDSEGAEVKVAKELVEMAKHRTIDIDRYLGKGNYSVEFPTYDDLLGKLNDYAGENGQYTPIVKFIRLKINDERIKFLEIVDTPGLNDPIASRTDKTREFIQMCDVVFFLSRCSAFLDKTDMDLLALQLPQKGVAKMFCLACQYDSGLNDVIFTVFSRQAAEVDVKTKLKQRAKKEFTTRIEMLKKKDPNSTAVAVLNECVNPIFVSSMAHNMSKLDVSEYNAEQQRVYNGLTEYDPISKSQLAELGNFDEVFQKFQKVIECRDETMAAKARNFLPGMTEEAVAALTSQKERILTQISILEKNDIEKLKKSKKETLSRKNNLQADIERIFGELNNQIDKQKFGVLSDIRADIKGFSDIAVREGTEEKTGYNEVSCSKWYWPPSWGKKDFVPYTYTASYTYFDVSDAVENVRLFAHESSSRIESGLNSAIDVPRIKKELLRAVVGNFDASDENFNPSDFRLMVESTLNNVEIPVFTLDVAEPIHRMSAEFSGEIREGNQKSELRLKLGAALSDIFEEIEARLIEQSALMKTSITGQKETLGEKLLAAVTQELEVIIQKFNDRENEITRNKEIIAALSECQKRISRN